MKSDQASTGMLRRCFHAATVPIGRLICSATRADPPRLSMSAATSVMPHKLHSAIRDARALRCDMQFSGWQNCRMEFHERLRAARERRFDEAKQAAEYLGIAVSTYANHEAGSRNPSSDRVARYAKAFSVPLPWLAYGEGPDTFGEVVPLAGRIGAGGSISTSTEQTEEGTSYQVKLAIALPEANVAYEVVGESMLPVFEPGTILVTRGHTANPIPFIGKRVAVETADGDRFVKTIFEGNEEGRYNLESLNAGHAVIRNAQVIWVAQIAAIIPADQWHKIEKLNGADKVIGPSHKLKSVSK